MSNKSRLQTNNTNLQALIAKANALPSAGSGGSSGGGSLETCTVTITGLADPDTYIHYIDDNFIYHVELLITNTSYNILKNSLFLTESRVNVNGAFPLCNLGMGALWIADGYINDGGSGGAP